MSFEDAVKLLMVSFDSTLKANLSVGMPLDLMVIERDTVRAAPRAPDRLPQRSLFPGDLGGLGRGAEAVSTCRRIPSARHRPPP
jgi:hypothetical protein